MSVARWLHLVWGGPPMPDKFRENLRLWADLHPGWEITLWGDDDLAWLEHRDLFDAAPRLVPKDAMWQFRSDIARYEILRKHAGLYVDCDVTPLRNIEPALADHDAFAVPETRHWVGNTILYVNRPNHPVIEHIVSDLRANVVRCAPGRPNRLSGPKFITERWRAHGCFEAETKLFFPLSWSDARAGRTADLSSLPPGTYTVHEWGHVREMMTNRRRGRRH